jgi:hypothetical protein
MKFLSRRPEWLAFRFFCLAPFAMVLTACQGTTATSAAPVAPVKASATACVVYDEAGDMAFTATTGATALYSVVMAADGKTYPGQTLAQLEALWP